MVQTLVLEAFQMSVVFFIEWGAREIIVSFYDFFTFLEGTAEYFQHDSKNLWLWSCPQEAALREVTLCASCGSCAWVASSEEGSRFILCCLQCWQSQLELGSIAATAPPFHAFPCFEMEHSPVAASIWLVWLCLGAVSPCSGGCGEHTHNVNLLQ